MITKDTEKVFFLDAYALIYRAFFALNKNPRMTSKGLNTSAIIGFLNTLYEVIRNEKPSHIGIAFDLGAPTLRTENFCDYKANREEMPPDLRASIHYIIKSIEGLNIPIYAVEGFEADDVIGTLAKKAEKAGFLTYMMTPDKDFGQLVSDNIYIYKPAKFGDPAMVMGPKEVCEKYGINTPEQLIDILGLWEKMFFSDGLALLLFTLKQINFHRRTISLFHKTLRLFVHYYLIYSSNSIQSLSQVRHCDPMDCSTPGLPVHYQLPEFTQTHVY